MQIVCCFSVCFFSFFYNVLCVRFILIIRIIRQKNHYRSVNKLYYIVLIPANEIKFFVNLKCQISAVILSVSISVTYLVTSVTLRELQSCDMRQIRKMMSLHSLAVSRLIKL